MDKKSVLILGCGPAGLLAAEAVWQATGSAPTIFSKKVKSEMFGAMFLHAPIPEVTPLEPDFNIDIVKSGTSKGYAKLVYGDPEHPVSWDVIPDESMRGWNLRAAYDKLWDEWEHHIVHCDITHADIRGALQAYDIVYSSIPAYSLCHEGHEFKSQPIWVVHGGGETGLIENVNDNDLMYYNGYPPDGSVEGMIGPDWYRYSQINKYRCWEYSSEPPAADHSPFVLSTGMKPISTECDCWPEVRRIGRFGRWEKGQLTHHAFHQVFEELNVDVV